MNTELDAVMMALNKLYEVYYDYEMPASAKWVRIKEILEQLMEAYDAWLD